MKETVTLSENELEDAVSAWLEKKYGSSGPSGGASLSKWKVTLETHMRSTGFGPMEQNEAYAIVTATRERT